MFLLSLQQTAGRVVRSSSRQTAWRALSNATYDNFPALFDTTHSNSDVNCHNLRITQQTPKLMGIYLCPSSTGFMLSRGPIWVSWKPESHNSYFKMDHDTSQHISYFWWEFLGANGLTGLVNLMAKSTRFLFRTQESNTANDRLFWLKLFTYFSCPYFDFFNPDIQFSSPYTVNFTLLILISLIPILTSPVHILASTVPVLTSPVLMLISTVPTFISSVHNIDFPSPYFDFSIFYINFFFAACFSCQLRLTFLVHRFWSPWWWRS
jgi:hypothetical protein